MNALTQIKQTQRATQKEIELGLHDGSSWHSQFKHSAYVFAGGLPSALTDGDVLAIFAQYGEVMDINLARDRKTGLSRGFVFLAYRDQRSTVLAVDNLNGAKVGGRAVRVEHVGNYRRKKAEMDGEDPDKVATASAPGSAGTSRSEEPSQPALPRTAPGRHEPWAASGSVFALLSESRSAAASRRGDGGIKDERESRGRSEDWERKEKREKKEKKERRERDRSCGEEEESNRHRSERRRDRDRSQEADERHQRRSERRRDSKRSRSLDSRRQDRRRSRSPPPLSARADARKMP